MYIHSHRTQPQPGEPLQTEPLIYKLPFLRKGFEADTILALLPISEIIQDGGSILHLKELQKLNTYRYKKRRESFLYGRICGKSAIHNHLNIPYQQFYITNGIFHHPVVKGKNIELCQVSISHSDTLSAALAFDETCPMGLDIEEITLKNALVVKKSFTKAEQALCIDDNYTIGLWSAKEAVSKALKLGLTIPLNFLAVKSILFSNGFYSISFEYFSQFKIIGFLFKKNFVAIAYPSRLQPDLSIITL